MAIMKDKLGEHSGFTLRWEFPGLDRDRISESLETQLGLVEELDRLREEVGKLLRASIEADVD